jgi:hypothetical protein
MPIDWTYDFAALGWDRGGSMNPECIKDCVAMLKRVESDPERFDVTTDGGWPRVGWSYLYSIDMVGGVPTLRCRGMFGVTTFPWYLLSDVRERRLSEVRTHED